MRRPRHLLFLPRQWAQIVEARRSGAGLRKALSNEKFELILHRLSNLNSGRICDPAKPLLRWNHPVRGTVSPGRASSRSPKTWELIVDLDPGSFARPPDMPAMAGSRSARVNFFTRGIPTTLTVSEISLTPRGLRPAREPNSKSIVTESSLLRNTPADQSLFPLHAIGANFSLDYFGTGYRASRSA